MALDLSQIEGHRPAPRNGKAQVDDAVRKFRAARADARRFHKAAIGDVDPDHCFCDWLGKVGAGDAAGIRKEYGRTLDYAFPDVLDRTGVRSKAALSESASGLSGGYLAPPELADELMGDVSEEAFVRPLARVIDMASASLNLPWPDATTTTGTAGVPTFFGGIQMFWTGEAKARAETEPKFRQLQLKAYDLSGVALMSNPLTQDALGINAWLRNLFARSIAWFEDYAFMQGSGVGQPLGVLNAPATIKVTRNAASQVKYVDVAAMDADLLPHSFLHAMWLITVSAMVQVTQLIDASGKTAWTPNFPNYFEDGKKSGAANRSIGILFNRPMYITEKLPALGTLGDVILFDPSLYVIGDRKAVEVAVSTEYPTAYPNYQTAWRILERVDGQPLVNKSITLQDQATVVSPYVVLN